MHWYATQFCFDSPPCGWQMPTPHCGLIGNGLISTLLVIYLASDLGASGLSLSLILAAPRFAGLLRLGVPALMARLRARKAVCIAAYVTQLDCVVCACRP